MTFTTVIVNNTLKYDNDNGMMNTRRCSMSRPPLACPSQTKCGTGSAGRLRAHALRQLAALTSGARNEDLPNKMVGNHILAKDPNICSCE